jgi:hypothetical protein
VLTSQLLMLINKEGDHMKFKTIKAILISSIVIILTCIFILIIDGSIVSASKEDLYCKRLKPGMSMEEVKNVLSEIGTYDLRKYYESELIGIVFTDPIIEHRYGGPYLNFRNSNYDMAIILVSGSDLAPLCKGP